MSMIRPESVELNGLGDHDRVRPHSLRSRSFWTFEEMFDISFPLHATGFGSLHEDNREWWHTILSKRPPLRRQKNRRDLAHHLNVSNPFEALGVELSRIHKSRNERSFRIRPRTTPRYPCKILVDHFHGRLFESHQSHGDCWNDRSNETIDVRASYFRSICKRVLINQTGFVHVDMAIPGMFSIVDSLLPLHRLTYLQLLPMWHGRSVFHVPLFLIRTILYWHRQRNRSLWTNEWRVETITDRRILPRGCHTN